MTDTTMRADVRCEKTELLTSSCAHCHPNPEGEQLAAALGAFGPADETKALAAVDPAVLGPPFRAQHSSGFCRTCRVNITRGEWIRYDGEAGYVHLDCP